MRGFCYNMVMNNGGQRSYTEWSQLVAKLAINVVDYLRPANEAEAKTEFLANQRLVRPRFTYNEINNADAKILRSSIAELLKELREDKTLMAEQRDYFTVELGQCWYELELVQAARSFNTSTSRSVRETQAERFRRANEAIYGRFHADTFWSLLRERVAQIDYSKLTNDQRKLYHEMLESIGVMRRNRKKRFAPRPKTVRVFGNKMRGLYSHLLCHIPDNQEEFTPRDAAKIVNEIIRDEIGAWSATTKRGTGFRAVVDETRSTAAVSLTEKRIYFPGKRSAGNYSRLELEKIIVHEFGVHVVRALTAEHQDLRVFYDNASYSRLTEEGLAKVCEQALDGVYDDIGIARYVAIGLITECGKTFREAYEILWRLESLLEERNQSECFDLVNRATRGTAVLPINTDLSYYRGANLVWKYIEEHLNDVGLAQVLFLSGKTDFLNQDRKRLIKTLREDKLI